jgi:predicted enzyme related to lactoylglutathione lyase
MTVLPLRHVALTARTDQFDVVSDFYQRIFGWSKTRDMSAPHGRVHILADGLGGEIELPRLDGESHRYVFFYDPAENCVELSESP